jgi:hypothetical protein
MIENSSNTKFNENLSDEGRFVTYGEANMTKLITVSRNFSNRSKNKWSQITTTPNVTMMYTGTTWYYH